MTKALAWRGPVPDGYEIKPFDSYGLVLIDGEPVPDAVTGDLLRERTPCKMFRAVPVTTPETRPAFPMLSNETIAAMIVKSMVRDGEIPNGPEGNGPSGNGGAKVPRPNGPRPVTPISGVARPLPKMVRP